MEPINHTNATPGNLLRRQRQHIGWTIDEIANALCLSPDQIQALEMDRFDEMGGSTFVLGYLRSYARMVGVEIEDAIQNYRNEIPEYEADAENLPGHPQRKKRKAKRSKLDLALAAAGVLAIMVVVGAIYFWPMLEQASDPVDELVQGLVSTDGLGQAPAESPGEAFAQAPDITPEEVLSAFAAGDPLPLSLRWQTLDEVIRKPLSSTGSASDANRLVLIFDEGSWVDVRDDSGQRLLSQTVAGGNTVSLTGKPPFQVFLGNAAGVRVKYQGRIDDLVPSKKGLFARFVVGEEL